MHSPAPSTHAQAALELLRGDNPTSALVLMAPLIESGLLTFDDPVVLFESAAGARAPAPVTLPLAEALRRSMKPGSYRREFHSVEVADRLCRHAPTLFAPPDRPGWLWTYLHEWSRQDADDLARTGFSPNPRWTERCPDHWTAHLIARLPAESFAVSETQAGLEALVRLGFSQACSALLQRQPALWTAVDAKGALVVGKANGAWMMDIAAHPEYGANLWAPLPDGRPLWRALAPKAPTALPAEGSLTMAVETWAAGPADAGDAGRRQMLDGFLRKNLAARMTHRSWTENEPAERLKYLDRLPANWGNDEWPNTRRDLPLWAEPFIKTRLSKDKKGQGVRVREAKAWARTLEERPAWRAAIGPLADFAAWIVKNGTRAGEVEACPDAVLEGARHPAARTFVERLVAKLPASFGDVTALQALADAVLLQATLPASAGHVEERRRLRL